MIQYSGLGGVREYAKREKYVRNNVNNVRQTKINIVRSTSSAMSLEDDTVGAEMCWAAFLCQNDISVNIGDSAAKTFAAMFPSSEAVGIV